MAAVERAAKRNEIQWLRALAATEVVFVHSDLLTKHFTDYRLIAEDAPLAGIGVELFFILSGYVICMRAPSYATGRAFMTSRILRLFPMYWIFTSLVLLAYFINPAWQQGGGFDQLSLTRIAQSYLTLPQWDYPILGVGWTLEFEMVFYWLVALAMLGWSMTGHARLAIAWLLVVMGFIGCLQGPEPGWGVWAFHIFSPYMLAFGFGWLLCCVEAMDRPARIKNLALFVTIAGAAYLVGTEFGDRLLFRIAFVGLIFYGFIACRWAFTSDNLINRIVMKAGDASFSIYLSHWFVLSPLGKLLGTVHPPAYSSELVRFLGVAASIAVGVWLFNNLEKPIDRCLRSGGTAADFPWLRLLCPSLRAGTSRRYRRA